jgi:lipopolysaccharide/colanic/teichoic acid biosynthesis glycosyltransferase
MALTAGAAPGDRPLGQARARWQRPRLSRSVVIFAHDLAAALTSLALARLLAQGGPLSSTDLGFLVDAGPLFLALAGGSFLAFGLHRRIWSYTSIGDLGAIIKAATLAVALFAAIGLAAGGTPELPRAFALIEWMILIVLLCGSRLGYRLGRQRARRVRARAVRAPAAAEVPVLLYGCGQMAAIFLGAVHSTPATSLRVIGIIDDAGARRGRSVHNVPVLGAPEELDRIIAELAVQGIHPQRLVLTRAEGDRRFAERCRARHGLELHFLPDILGVPAAAPGAAASAAGTAEPAYLRARRPVELGLAALALLTLLPLLGLIALLLLLHQGRPILSSHGRLGRNLRPFALYRFRTTGASPPGARGSRLGRLLRRTRLDELPQLLNLLRGEMALIGPTPLPPGELPGGQGERSALRPGITGWAQVNGGRRLTVEQQLALDLWYARNAGPLLDLRIVGRTLKILLLGEGRDWLESEPAPAGGRRQRLLVVNRFFDPDPCATSQLLTQLVDALDAQGFAVAVLAGRHSYLNTGRVLSARSRRAGIEVRRLPHTGFGRFTLPGRALDSATFAISAFLALLVRARPGDLILAKTDPPLVSVLAWLVARLTGARLVNWCQDLFPETAAAMGLRFARGPLGGALRALRNASLRGAAINVALSPGMAARLVAERVPPQRLTVIPNWADGRLVRPLAHERNPLRAAWGLGGRFVIGYSGNLGHAHEVDPLVELITLLQDEPAVMFLFIGAGAGYRPLRAAVAGRGLENVLFRPYQERAQLPLSLTAPDVHLVTLRPEWEGLVMPSKLYGALAAGRPVVFIGDPAGDTASIVQAGLGLVARPDRMPWLAAELRALSRDPARLARLGAAARQSYEAAPMAASLDAWTRCLRAAALPAPAALPEAVAAE